MVNVNPTVASFLLTPSSNQRATQLPVELLIFDGLSQQNSTGLLDLLGLNFTELIQLAVSDFLDRFQPERSAEPESPAEVPDEPRPAQESAAPEANPELPPESTILIEGGITYFGDNVNVISNDNAGDDRYELRGRNSTLQVAGNEGANTYVISGDNNYFDIRDVGRDDDNIILVGWSDEWDTQIQLNRNNAPTIRLINESTGTEAIVSGQPGDNLDALFSRLSFQPDPTGNTAQSAIQRALPRDIPVNVS